MEKNLLKWKQQNEQTIPFTQRVEVSLAVLISVIFARFSCLHVNSYFFRKPDKDCLPACLFVCEFSLSLPSHMYDFQQINTNAAYTHHTQLLYYSIWGSSLYYSCIFFVFVFFDRFVMNMNKQRASFLMRIFATTTISIVRWSFFSCNSHCAIAYYIDIDIDLCLCVGFRVCSSLSNSIQCESFATMEPSHAYFVSILLLCFNSIVM